MLRTGQVSLPVLVLVSFAIDVWAAPPLPEGGRARDRQSYQVSAGAELPFLANRVHRVGQVGLSITNYGILGGGLDDCTDLPAHSIEFPLNSFVDYNYSGGIWVGAVVDGDTLVSLALNGNSGPGNELFPRKYPEGDIITRTTRPVLRQEPNSLCPDVFFSEDAVSEQDFIAMYSDTLGRGFGLGR